MRFLTQVTSTDYCIVFVLAYFELLFFKKKQEIKTNYSFQRVFKEKYIISQK